MTDAPDPEAEAEAKAACEAERDLFERAYPLRTDSPHAAEILERGERVRFYLADVTGLSEARIAALLPVVTAEMTGRSAIPVFVTDLTDYRLFRDAEVIFEALPPLREGQAAAPDLDWELRRAEVMQLIRSKWNPAGEVALGDQDP